MAKKLMKTSARLFLMSGIIFILTAGMIVVLVNYSMRQQALVEAESKMSIMAEQYFAIHTYFSQKLKPAVFKLTDPIRSKAYFDPVWMSSTYAIREINKYIKKSKGQTEYYLKDAAMNARSPENEATPYEKGFLSELAVNPKLKEKSSVQTIDGRRYLVLLRRGEVMEASCLRCHSSPDKAPADMVRFYGPKRSFHRKIGDWVQTVSIRVPLEEAYANANRFSVKLSVLLLTLLVALFSVLYFLNRRLVFKPLSMIHQKALQISTNEQNLGDEIPLPPGKELNELATTFNSMSKSLRHHVDNLEARVRERTKEVSKANENLEIEIQDRKKTEEALRESEALLQAAMDQSQAGIAIADAPDGKLRYVNNSGLGIRGKAKEEIVDGIGIEQYVASWQILHFDGTPYKDDEVPLARAIMYGEVCSKEFIVRRPDEEDRIVLANAAPIFNDKGEVFAGIVVFLDVTDRKQAEEALRDVERRNQALLDHSPVCHKMVDLNFNLIYMSANGYKMLKLDKNAEMSGQPYPFAFFSAAFRNEMTEKLMKVKETGETITMETLTKDSEGNEIWLDSALLPVLDDDGRIDYITVASTNTTQRKRAEEEKAELESQLQRAQKMEAIGTLAGGVAHDLNNILGGLVSYPELLLLQLPEDSPLRKSILTIQKSGEKAAAVVQDLLTLARRGVVVTEVVNPNKIIAEYLKSPEHEKLQSYHPGVQIETHLEKDILNILGSPTHLSKTVMNLVSNAAEAMPEGGNISISTENRYVDRPIGGYDNVKEGDYVVLIISDTGTGISPDDMEKIFEPFYTKKKMGRSGTGLGMAVVWGTVKDHNGYIHVQSTEGIGTDFTLYFPVTRKSLEEKSEISLKDCMGNGEAILVVDDVEEQRETASGMLKELGYSVVSVPSGEEAVEYLRTHKIDLLVLDMIMDPGMDGLDTYKKVLELHSEQKALIASGFSETDRVKEIQGLGAGAYIKKPFLLEKIGIAVKKELEK